ncbi:hypothetical protein HMPREF3214_01147 [Alloscardovia omnicolens]|nr:hypothetical protein HMPREF3214_01147 [Alloscardovia omnicolens]
MHLCEEHTCNLSLPDAPSTPATPCDEGQITHAMLLSCLCVAMKLP